MFNRFLLFAFFKMSLELIFNLRKESKQPIVFYYSDKLSYI